MTRNQIDAGYKNSDFQTRPWIPLCEIAKGDVSVVFKVIDLEGTSLAAMKVEKIPQKEKKLKKKHIEKDILDVLRESPYSLHLIAHSYVNHIRVTVMTLAGPSLGVIKRLMNNKFSDSTILRLAIRTLLSLKDLHEHGYIHRDLEPDNIALSYCKSSRSVYLLDFGQAREYARLDKGKWILRAARDKIPFKGSVQYCSPKMHDEKELGRIDDLWSWLYIFMEMRVFLPWTDSTLSSYFASRKRTELEETLNSDPFLTTTFLPIVKIMKTSEFADRPDYSKIYEILADKMVQIGVKWTDPMDYDMITARHNFFSTTPMNEEQMTEEQLAAAFQETIVPGGSQYVIGPLVPFYGVEKEKTKEEKEKEKEKDDEKEKKKEKEKEKEKDVEKKKEKVAEKPKEKEKPKPKEKGKSREVIAKEKDRKMGSQEKTTDKSSDAPSKNIVEKTSKQQKTGKQPVPPPPKKNTKTSSTSSVSHQTPPSVAEKPPSSLPSHPPPRSMKKKPARTPAKQKLKAN